MRWVVADQRPATAAWRWPAGCGSAARWWRCRRPQRWHPGSQGQAALPETVLSTGEGAVPPGSTAMNSAGARPPASRYGWCAVAGRNQWGCALLGMKLAVLGTLGWSGFVTVHRRSTMVEVGDRVLVESEKVGSVTRSGVVTAVVDRLITVRWDSGSESVFVPSAGSLRVTGHQPPAGEPDSS